MTKKKRPKASTRNVDPVVRADTVEVEQAEPEQAGADQPQDATNQLSPREPSPSRRRGQAESALGSPATPFTKEDISHATADSSSGSISPSGSISGCDTNEESASAAQPSPNDELTNKRAEARRIVNRYSMYSALGGLVPVALIDTAGITVIAVRMVQTLSRHYGVPPNLTPTQAWVTGMIGGAAAPTLASLSLGTFLRFLPGANVVALAISSTAAAACVRTLGENLIAEFEQIVRNSIDT